MTTSDPQPDTVLAAAITGKRLSALTALRDTLARSIDQCDSMRDLAALSRQLTDVLVQIDQVAPVEKRGDVVDEIAQRRAARRAGPGPGASRSRRSV